MAAELNREICEAAGIVGFVPHDARHTAATHLEAMGAPRSVIAAILGHRAEYKMTLRYSHYRQEREMRVALEAWEKRILTLVGERLGDDSIMTGNNALPGSGQPAETLL